mmetsp:Transcript_31236/g.89556  ORF Transcript_31236/g.89556 Transcript_31236/m.89556 type:complete len:212 (+) Transcript_31236:433-1068(+)
MQYDSRAERMEITAPILACPWSSGSIKAWLAMKSATVSPTPPRAAMEKRSPTLMPAGRPKPMAMARSAKKAMPRVLPISSAMTTDPVMPPTEPNLTPAFARPKKNMPRSTGSLRWCSKVCSGADSSFSSMFAAFWMIVLLRRSSGLVPGKALAIWPTFCMVGWARSPSCGWVPAECVAVAGMKGITKTSAKAGCTCAMYRPSQAIGPQRKT